MQSDDNRISSSNYDETYTAHLLQVETDTVH
jgi:hypothetical protein